MDYALIENGQVVNLIWLSPGNEDEFPGAVALNGVPAGIGDTYDGEYFYRDGEVVLRPEEVLSLALIAYREGVQEA